MSAFEKWKKKIYYEYLENEEIITKLIFLNSKLLNPIIKIII